MAAWTPVSVLKAGGWFLGEQIFILLSVVKPPFCRVDPCLFLVTDFVATEMGLTAGAASSMLASC